MANLNMTVRTETRLCIVNGKVGHFHAWEHYSKPLPACPLVVGEPAGVLSQIFGIVEFEDGTRRVDPTEIIFCDEDTDFLYQINKDEDAKKRIIQGPPVKEKGAEPSQDIHRNDILNILLHADAVTCTVTGYEPMLYASKALYEIPSDHQVTIDYNKMAKALYDAGYRRGGLQ